MPTDRPTAAETDSRSSDDWTVKRILDWTTEYLRQRGSESPRLDAEILLAHARGCRRIDLYTRYGEILSEPQRSAMRNLVRRRSNAEPVAYLVGTKEFYSLPFAVTPDVLIPRPETETLVLEVVEIAKSSPAERLKLLDLCTGSGCIAVAAAHTCPKFDVVATDLSEAALAIARRNAAEHGVADRIEFRAGDLFDAVPRDAIRDDDAFDIIVSNSPYVADGDELPADIQHHEPAMALRAGPEGLDILRRIAHDAPPHLNAGGHLLLELDPKQAEPVAELLRDGFEEIRFLKDLSGVVRFVHASGRKG